MICFLFIVWEFLNYCCFVLLYLKGRELWCLKGTLEEIGLFFYK